MGYFGSPYFGARMWLAKYMHGIVVVVPTGNFMSIDSGESIFVPLVSGAAHGASQGLLELVGEIISVQTVGGGAHDPTQRYLCIGSLRIRIP